MLIVKLFKPLRTSMDVLPHAVGRKAHSENPWKAIANKYGRVTSTVYEMLCWA